MAENVRTAFINDLLQQNWNSIYNKTDMHCAYDEFIKTFRKLYDKNCPIKEVKSSSRPIQSWITKGLQNACKKKNTLYIEFIKLRTIESEHKY